jgi:transposase InsO family protein
MTEDQKKQVAIFRFGVISDFVTRTYFERGEREKLLKDKCARSWQIPFSDRTRLSRATILRWIRLYQKSGQRLESLMPAGRNDRGGSRAIDEDTAGALVRLKREMPRITVPALLEQMERRGLISSGAKLAPSTVYRFLHSQKLMDRGRAAPVDRRRFEAELPNDLWQSDAMHGPMLQAGGKNKKTYLFAFIDDMSRIIPHAEFYTTERLHSYLDALRQALLKRGLPRKLYVDNGPAFRSRHLEEICASLGIALIHSKPYKPQGRGKIERFFRTVRMQFLPGFMGKTLDEINQAMELWITDVYHQRKHGGIGQAPMKRFAEKMECIRPAPNDLEDYFRKRARRRVATDRSVSLGGRLYEAPVPLIGQQVTLLYHEHDPKRVEIRLQNRSHGFLTPLDLAVNARVKRNKNNLVNLEESQQNTPAGGSLFLASKKSKEAKS